MKINVPSIIKYKPRIQSPANYQSVLNSSPTLDEHVNKVSTELRFHFQRALFLLTVYYV